MENIAHTLLGATLAKAGLDKKTAWALPTLMIAANLPDIDNFVGRGQSYFDNHRGITHSLVGVFGLSFALAATVWVCGRFRFARRWQIRFLPLWLISAIGVLSHPFLDFLGDYGWRPFLPFTSKWYYGDMLAIVDPWIWLIFGCSLFLAAGSKSGKTAWIVFACVLDAVIFFAAGRIFALCWTVLVLAVAGGLRTLCRYGIRPPRAALIIFLAYLSLASMAHYVILRRAWKEGPALVSDAARKISVLPGRPGTVGRWTLVIEGTGNYYVADVGLQNWAEHYPKFDTYAKNLGNSCYLEALAQPQIASMARFARFPYVGVSVSGGLCSVELRDLRYARRNTSCWGVATATVPLNFSRQSTAGSNP